ncbi:MAG: hypothetical protein ACOCQW_03700 [Halanaerobiaceae bacterium]
MVTVVLRRVDFNDNSDNILNYVNENCILMMVGGGII